MAVRTVIKDGKKLFEVYVNGFNARGTRVQRKRTNIELTGALPPPKAVQSKAGI